MNYALKFRTHKISKPFKNSACDTMFTAIFKFRDKIKKQSKRKESYKRSSFITEQRNVTNLYGNIK